MVMRWVYSSKAGYEGTPYHHFLADFDSFKPYVGRDECLIGSKTKGHYHVIRPHADLTISQYLAECKRRNVESHYRLGLNLKGVGYLFVYHRIPELVMLERFRKVESWDDVVGR